MKLRLRSRTITSLAASFAVLGAASAAPALVVALSNDDGWDAPGIQAMKTALVAAGHSVTLAGPLDEQSGSSAANNFVSNLVIKKEAVDEYSVAVAGGTEGAEPATSALIAIGIAKDANGGVAPDLLVSGINAGANIGAATQLSGTVGGAIVALANGLNGTVPAIAISTDEPCDLDDPPGGDLPACEAANAVHFANVASFLTDFIAHLETKPGFLDSVDGLLPTGVGLNINYPPIAPEAIQGVSLNRQGKTLVIGGVPLAVDFVCFACAVIPVGASSPGGIGGAGFDPTPDVADSDSAAFGAGFITVVPIEPDYTAAKNSRFESVIETFDF
jgi:5'-nucleotidase